MPPRPDARPSGGRKPTGRAGRPPRGDSPNRSRRTGAPRPRREESDQERPRRRTSDGGRGRSDDRPRRDDDRRKGGGGRRGEGGGPPGRRQSGDDDRRGGRRGERDRDAASRDGRPPRSSGRTRRQEDAGVRERSPEGRAWGNVARRGAANVRDGGRASAAWRAAGDAARQGRRQDRRRPEGAPGRAGGAVRPGEQEPEVVVPADLVEETPVGRTAPRRPEPEDRDGHRDASQVLRPDEGLDGEDLGWHQDEDEAWQPEEWIDEGLVRDEAQDAVQRGRHAGPGRSGRPRRGSGGGGAAKRWSPMAGTEDEDVAEVQRAQGREGRSGGSGAEASLEAELRNAVGATKAARFDQRMRDAATAFKRGRYDEARRILRPMVDQAPRVSALRELYGLTLYRLERWRAATNELEVFRTLTGGLDQHPVLADCYRALGRHADVEDLWNELAAASPNAALVAEGRIVAAGDLADQGRVEEAIKVLEPGLRPARRAKDHHLRVAYALADLYERAGDLPRARELFQRVAGSDPDFVDVQARIGALD